MIHLTLPLTSRREDSSLSNASSSSVITGLRCLIYSIDFTNAAKHRKEQKRSSNFLTNLTHFIRNRISTHDHKHETFKLHLSPIPIVDVPAFYTQLLLSDRADSSTDVTPQEDQPGKLWW